MRVTGTALPENFEVNPNGAAFRILRTNQTLFALDVLTVETVEVNGLDGADQLLVGDLTGVANLATIRFNGGTGADTLEITGSAGADTFAVTNAGAPRLTITRLVPAGLLLDVGTVEFLRVNTGGGADTVTVGTLAGVADLQTIRLNGGTENDTLDASAVLAGAVTLTLEGGAGVDTLAGGRGNDTLNGGADDDTFRFADNWGTDMVLEAAGEGTDKLDFALVTALHPLTFGVTLSGTVTVADGANLVTHTGGAIEGLVGGAGSDLFNVTPPVTPPAVPLTIDGQGGASDVLNFNGDPAAFTNTGTAITAIAGAPPPVYVNHSGLEVVNIVLSPFSLLRPAPSPPEGSPAANAGSPLPVERAGSTEVTTRVPALVGPLAGNLLADASAAQSAAELGVAPSPTQAAARRFSPASDWSWCEQFPRKVPTWLTSAVELSRASIHEPRSYLSHGRNRFLDGEDLV